VSQGGGGGGGRVHVAAGTPVSLAIEVAGGAAGESPGGYCAPALAPGVLSPEAGAAGSLLLELLDADGDGVGDGLDQCAGGDDTVDVDADGVPDACQVFGLTLDVGAVEPGFSSLLTLAGCTPGGTVHLIATGRGQGAGPCPAAIGVCVDLVSPKYLGQVLCDATATADFLWAVPAGIPLGTTVDLQAAQVGEVSPVVTRVAGP
jgi:hypothetical protein